MSNAKQCFQSQSRRGFTLVELLVVIGVIALLISILMPALSKARAAARTVQCAVRMKQVTTAMFMYANENRSSLPPICLDIDAWSNTFYNGPGVWPSDPTQGPTFFYNQNSFLSPFINGAVPVDLFVCPELYPDNNWQNGWFSYRYNKTLGGDDPRRYHVAPVGGTHRTPVPWKIGDIPAPGNMALVIEGSLNTSAAMVNGGASHIGLEEEPNAQANSAYGNYASPNSYHSPRYAYLAHQLQIQSTTYSAFGGSQSPVEKGVENVAFCDGSVRSITWAVDRYPAKAIDGVYIDPYHPTDNW